MLEGRRTWAEEGVLEGLPTWGGEEVPEGHGMLVAAEEAVVQGARAMRATAAVPVVLGPGF